MSDVAFRAPKGCICTVGNEAGHRAHDPDCPMHGDMSLPASIPPQEDACSRCGGEKEWEDCWNCEDGFSGHDCGEDCCCCLDPEENVVCDICRGEGGFLICRCTEANPPAGTISEYTPAGWEPRSATNVSPLSDKAHASEVSDAATKAAVPKAQERKP